MDYEKKYNEALERARKDYNSHLEHLYDGYRKNLEEIFPELSESEGERIIKGLENFLWCIANGGMNDRGTMPSAEMCQKWLAYLEKQKEQKPEHFELKAGKWYICHRAFCCRADHLTVKEGERFMCEKDGVVKGFVIKEPEKYFKECSAPAPMEDEQKEQKPAERFAESREKYQVEWSEEDEKDVAHIIRILADCYVFGKHDLSRTDHDNLVNKLKSLQKRFSYQTK